MFNGSHIPSRVKKIGEAACAAVASAALLLAYASPALAQNTANGITETGDPNSAAASQTANPQTGDSDPSSNSGSPNDTSGDSANDSTNSADANTANNSGDANGNSAADAQSQDAAQNDGADAPSATAADAALSKQFQDDFVAACPAGATSRTITVTGNIALTKSVMKPTCDIVIVSDGNPHTISWGEQAKGSALWPEAGHTVTIGAKGNEKANNLIFTNNGTGQPLVHNYGTVNIYGGTFQNNTADRGAVVFNNGTLNISGGTFQNNTADRGAVVFNDGTLNIYGGTFKNNTATGDGGGVVFNGDNATLTINDGVFSGNKTRERARGGVVFNKGALTVTGGTYSKNTATIGGGALAQDNISSAVTTVTGGLFDENAQEYDFCGRTPEGDVADSRCRDTTNGGGGGAIHTDGGELTIQGAVTFTKNHANAAAFMTGGGAIYAKGTLWVFNDPLDSSKKPLFDGNWTAVGVGNDNSQYLKDTDNALPTGGAGGAIFLQNGGSKAYFMGGVYTNNTSGYLGGAIYTEEGSTSFMGKAVAESNVAGHFGGGLWLCPSGKGEASEGGNIALLNNSVNSDIDSNRDNHGEQFEAGADFAMMNPKGKDYAESTFKLLNTWFMDRSEPAVNWYWDGTPITQANGFSDDYQAPDWSDESKSNAVKRYADDALDRNTVGYPQRYNSDSPNELAKVKVNAPAELHLVNPDRDQSEDTHLGDSPYHADSSSTFNNIYTGIALKAQLTEYGEANGNGGQSSTVWNNAAVRFTNNVARLSGGAFGTNGVISFSTPYSASWDKVAASDANSGDTNKEPVYLDGSVWTLRTQNGGMLNEYLRPLDCQNNNAAKPSTCWHEVTDADGSEWREVDIRDGGIRDTNPQPGKIGVENLKPGTYLLKEKVAPNGYHATTNVYTFTIVKQEDGIAEEPTITLDKNVDPDSYGPIKDNAIGNSPMSGSVSWSKNNTKDDVTALQDLPGSEWTITKLTKDGKDDTSFANLKVTDCVLGGSVKECPETQSGSKELKDSNGAEGRFTVDGLLAGNYKLVETKAPGGYQQPDNDTYYTFTIDPASNAAVTLAKHTSANDTAGTEVDGNQIANTPTEVSWKKVDVADDSKLLSGTEWTITKWDTTTNSAVGGDAADSRTVTDCTSADCAKQSNTTRSYVDKNPAEGHFTVRELKYSSQENAETKYKLFETKAQDGYAKPDANNTYAIITIDANGKSSMTLYGEWNTSSNVATTQCLAQKQAIQSSDNPSTGTAHTAASATATAVARIAVRFGIPAERRTVVPTAGGEAADECTLTNAKLVVALPFTGGTDARTWLLIGGVAAVAAAIILALINEYRKRRGLV